VDNSKKRAALTERGAAWPGACAFPGEMGQARAASRQPPARGNRLRGGNGLASGRPRAAAYRGDGVDLQAPAAARARVSQRRRTVSNAALSTVNVHAVIHADPASGSAAPSTITAT
jgi:hypothetical protein